MNFVGILNGADYNEWDPVHDREIAATYSAAKPDGKRACTRALRDLLKLPNREDWPVVGMVTRMTAQKGVDLLRDALDAVMRLDLQLVMLASGDAVLEKFFKDAELRYPEKLRAIIEFNNTLAHRIQAGSDAFLMPSRFEPCGLTQMYALRYGSCARGARDRRIARHGQRVRSRARHRQRLRIREVRRGRNGRGAAAGWSRRSGIARRGGG